jgi:hypothetical protein
MGRRSSSLSRWCPFCLALLAVSLRGQSGAVADENERVILLEAFRVNAGPIENFGFQTTPMRWGSEHNVVVTAVIPNTAAAKAGLQPGDMILSSDGEAVENVRLARGLMGGNLPWHGFYVPPDKRVLLERGDAVTWVLEVRPHARTEFVRTVTLTLPTSPPRWGGKVWSPPQGRAPARVAESGPLAERAKLILDHGVAIMLREDLAHNLPRRSFYYGFQWSVGEGRTFIVSQARGRTDIILQAGKIYYLTSPTAVLERAVVNERVPQLDPWREIPSTSAQLAFQAEVDFWLKRVGQVSARWPLELIPEDTQLTERSRRKL